ncbi:hypothetical protein [Pedobacter helvus]|uniref:Alginate lyase 2 domain-containing protein n=1 Tax=Pedobacter helvus TaxID=2563444 RepID=A0ABW9JQ30_9SPHI|nr:hypothetical protein [Pedobacter ureilyticus]
MRKITFFTVCLMLVQLVGLAQAPSLIKKKISDYPLVDGSKLPTEAGWQLRLGDEQKEGKIEITANKELFIKAASGEAYTVQVGKSTETVFSPTTDYTIEFKTKVPLNNGRGLDITFRDGKNFAKLVCVTHNRVILNGEKEALAHLNGKEYHVYRIAVERDKAKAHLYIDGTYKTSFDLLAKANSAWLSFGKGNTKADTEIVMQYFTYDLTGAYAPL